MLIKDRWLGVYPNGDFDSLLDRDSFVIAISTDSHHQIVLKIRQHRLRVYVENLPAETSDEYRELGQVAPQRNRTLLVWHVFFLRRQCVSCGKRLMTAGLGQSTTTAVGA
ncbi:MAG: hypothetical protein GY880_31645 [Planctomycetaceae bacterium]|nr:hypothetical protein [Planctomycetaceae bacterium]